MLWTDDEYISENDESDDENIEEPDDIDNDKEYDKYLRTLKRKHQR